MGQESAALLGFELGHVGLHMQNWEEAKAMASILCGLFDLPVRSGPCSLFVGSMFECVVPPYWGTKGHIAICTNDIDQAEAYLREKGVAFHESSRQYREDGHLRTIYLKEAVNGFAIHLLQK